MNADMEAASCCNRGCVGGVAGAAVKAAEDSCSRMLIAFFWLEFLVIDQIITPKRAGDSLRAHHRMLCVAWPYDMRLFTAFGATFWGIGFAVNP